MTDLALTYIYLFYSFITHPLGHLPQEYVTYRMSFLFVFQQLQISLEDLSRAQLYCWPKSLSAVTSDPNVHRCKILRRWQNYVFDFILPCSLCELHIWSQVSELRGTSLPFVPGCSFEWSHTPTDSARAKEVPVTLTCLADESDDHMPSGTSKHRINGKHWLLKALALSWKAGIRNTINQNYKMQHKNGFMGLNKCLQALWVIMIIYKNHKINKIKM